MNSLTIILPPQELKKLRLHAKSEGFKKPADWVQFLVERQLLLEESPRLSHKKIISEMQKTRLYKKQFLSELEDALRYADSAAK